jgi:hypothetical protein
VHFDQQISRSHFFECILIQRPVKKSEWVVDRQILTQRSWISTKFRGFSEVNFFTLSRSGSRSETSRRFDATLCDDPPDPDPVAASNSGVNYLVYYSIFMSFSFTSPPIALSTFGVAYRREVPIADSFLMRASGAVFTKYAQTPQNLRRPANGGKSDHQSQ